MRNPSKAGPVDCTRTSCLNEVVFFSLIAYQNCRDVVRNINRPKMLGTKTLGCRFGQVPWCIGQTNVQMSMYQCNVHNSQPYLYTQLSTISLDTTTSKAIGCTWVNMHRIASDAVVSEIMVKNCACRTIVENKFQDVEIWYTVCFIIIQTFCRTLSGR